MPYVNVVFIHFSSFFSVCLLLHTHTHYLYVRVSGIPSVFLFRSGSGSTNSMFHMRVGKTCKLVSFGNASAAHSTPHHRMKKTKDIKWKKKRKTTQTRASYNCVSTLWRQFIPINAVMRLCLLYRSLVSLIRWFYFLFLFVLNVLIAVDFIEIEIETARRYHSMFSYNFSVFLFEKCLFTSEYWEISINWKTTQFNWRKCNKFEKISAKVFGIISHSNCWKLLMFGWEYCWIFDYNRKVSLIPLLDNWPF